MDKTKANNKGENPNRFPEETLSSQRSLPYEGDDQQAAMEDGARNQKMPGASSGWIKRIETTPRRPDNRRK